MKSVQTDGQKQYPHCAFILMYFMGRTHNRFFSTKCCWW